MLVFRPLDLARVLVLAALASLAATPAHARVDEVARASEVRGGQVGYPVLDEVGKVAFAASQFQMGETPDIVYLWDDGQLSELYRLADQGYPVNSGLTLLTHFIDPSTLRRNDAGQFAFRVRRNSNTGAPEFNKSWVLRLKPGAALPECMSSPENSAIGTFGVLGTRSILHADVLGGVVLNAVGHVAGAAALSYSHPVPGFLTSGRTMLLSRTTDPCASIRENGGSANAFVGYGGEVLAESGEFIPGGSAEDRSFDDVSFPAMNDLSTVVFLGHSDDLNQHDSPNVGLFRGSKGKDRDANPGNLVTLLKGGDPANLPGIGSTLFQSVSIGSWGAPNVNNAGRVAVVAPYTSVGVVGVQRGVFYRDGSTLHAAAYQGQSVGGLFGNIRTFTDFARPSAQPLALNEAGDLAFVATVSPAALTGGIALDRVYRWNSATDSRTLIASEDQAVPGAGRDAAFISFGRVWLNDAGVVLFEANILSASGLRKALVIGDGHEFFVLAREGMVVSGLADPVEGIAASFDPINRRGQVALGLDDRAGSSVRATLALLYTPDLHWRETTGGDWNDREHWTLGLPPASVHDVFIDPATDLTVTGGPLTTSVRSLTVGGAAGVGTFALTANLLTKAALTVKENGVVTGDGTVEGRLQVDREGTVRVEANDEINFQVTSVVGLQHRNDGFIDVIGTSPTQLARASFTKPENQTFRGGLLTTGLFLSRFSRLNAERFTNTGEMDLGAGAAIESGLLTNAVGALLEITPSDGNLETVVLADGLNNQGEMQVLDRGYIATLQNMSFQGSGSLEIVISATTLGTIRPRIGAQQKLFANGPLRVTAANGFLVAAGDGFRLFLTPAIQGKWTTLTLPALAPGLVWDLSTLYTDGTLRVVAEAEPDADQIASGSDNCILQGNGSQLDTDGDGFGNACDGDLDNNGITNFGDLALMKSVFLKTGPLNADLTGDGVVNFADLARMKQLFLRPPGPSASAL